MKKQAVYWHVAGWFLYVGYEVFGGFLADKATSQYGWVLLSATVAEMIEFYLAYFVVFPRLLRPGRVGRLLAALMGVVGLYAALRYGVEEMLYPLLLGFRNSWGNPPSHTLFYSLYYGMPALAASLALWAGQSALHRERENQQLRGEKRAAEVAFLKTQINPHFLYSTLNMLYSMAYPVAKPVANAILKLSELMRYMLHESPDGQVTLEKELEYLHNYLDLYRLRFPDRFFVDFTVTGEPANRRVAPLILIPFVENAIKHGVLDDPENPVRICLHLDGKQLQFDVTNQCSDDNKDTTTGIGLPNLQRRLELLYPERHALRISEGNRQFITSLRLVG